MFRFVEQLQKKPHHVRKNVALGTSVITTLLVAGVWISVGNFSSPTQSTGTLVIESEERGDLTASPLKALGNDFSRVKDGLDGLIGNMNKEEDEVEIVEDPEPVMESEIESSESTIDYSFE